MNLKIAVSGKGGVGKTTLSALIAAGLSLAGRNVVAIDADPDANLAAALGLPAEQQPVCLAEMRELIAERTGAAGGYGGYFKLNPKVDDLPDRYAAKIGSIRLLSVGGVARGGGGCICPASALVKALLTYLVLGSEDAVIMDMEAGIEHLGRATTQSMDALLVVVDEGVWSMQTALRVRALAKDIGLNDVVAVVNRVGANTRLEPLRAALCGIPIVGSLPFDPRLRDPVVRVRADQTIEPTEILRELRPGIEKLLEALQARRGKG